MSADSFVWILLQAKATMYGVVPADTQSTHAAEPLTWWYLVFLSPAATNEGLCCDAMAMPRPCSVPPETSRDLAKLRLHGQQEEPENLIRTPAINHARKASKGSNFGCLFTLRPSTAHTYGVVFSMLIIKNPHASRRRTDRRKL